MRLSSPYLITLVLVIILSSCSKPTDVELKEETDLNTLLNEYVLLSTNQGTYIMFPDGTGLERVSGAGDAIWMNNRASFAVNSGSDIFIYNTLTRNGEKNIELDFGGSNMQFSPVLELFIYNSGRVRFVDLTGKSSSIPLGGLSDGKTSQVDDWVYYRDARNGYAGLYRMTLGSNGKLETLALSGSTTYSSYNVSYDGNFVAAYANSGSSLLLSIINTSTKAVSTINLTNKMSAVYYDPSFSRSGKYIYMIGDNAKSIYMIEKDGSNFSKINTFDFYVTRISLW